MKRYITRNISASVLDVNLDSLAREIDRALSSENIDSEVYVDDDMIQYDIAWGDWKHQHLYSEEIVKNLLASKGITDFTIYEDVFEEDGTDTYSATHTIEFK